MKILSDEVNQLGEQAINKLKVNKSISITIAVVLSFLFLLSGCLLSSNPDNEIEKAAKVKILAQLDYPESAVFSNYEIKKAKTNDNPDSIVYLVNVDVSFDDDSNNSKRRKTTTYQVLVTKVNSDYIALDYVSKNSFEQHLIDSVLEDYLID